MRLRRSHRGCWHGSNTPPIGSGIGEQVGFPPQPPEAGIPPEEDSVSIDAAAIFRAQFAQDGQAKAVKSLFDAIVGMITGGNDSAQAGHMHRTPESAYFARR